MKLMQADTTGVAGDGSLDHSFFYTFNKVCTVRKRLVLVVTPNGMIYDPGIFSQSKEGR